MKWFKLFLRWFVGEYEIIGSFWTGYDGRVRVRVRLPDGSRSVVVRIDADPPMWASLKGGKVGKRLSAHVERFVENECISFMLRKQTSFGDQ